MQARGSPSPPRVLSNPPHVDPPQQRRGDACVTFLSGQQKCAQQVIRFLPRRPNTAGTRAVLWKRRKKAKPKRSVHSPRASCTRNTQKSTATPTTPATCGISEDHTTDTWISKTETPQCSRQERLPPLRPKHEKLGAPTASPRHSGHTGRLAGHTEQEPHGARAGPAQPALIDTPSSADTQQTAAAPAE